MGRARIVFATVLVAGCGVPPSSPAVGPNPVSGSDPAVEGEPATRPGSPSTTITDWPHDGCDPTHVRACFDPPVLIAGTGKIGRKGENGWRPAFEGGPAIAAELSRPHFVMADARGTIYIADKDADAIRRVAPEGTISTVPGDFASPNGLWVARDGTLYVLDLGHARIVRVDRDGSTSVLLEVPGGIAIGRGLWVADDERRAFVASNTRVVRWTPEGGARTHVEGFRSLGNLVIDPQGALVVTDRGAGRVIRIGEDGTKSILAGDGGTGGGGDGQRADQTSLPGVRAIWFDADGSYFLGTHESSAVWHVDTEGIIHAILGEPDVHEVRGLSLTPGGDLLVVDDDGGFVRMLKRRPPSD